MARLFANRGPLRAIMDTAVAVIDALERAPQIVLPLITRYAEVRSRLVDRRIEELLLKKACQEA